MLLPVLVYVLALNSVLSVRTMMLIFAAVLAIADVIMYDYIAHRADRAFAKLNQE